MFNAGAANLTLTGCTLSGNKAGGGGLENFGTADLTDCTLSGNSALGGTPGAYPAAIGGLYNSAGTARSLYNPGTADLTDTIVAGNTNPTGGSDISGNASGSHNLIGIGGSGGLVNGKSGNIVLTSLTDLGLAPLGSYGGPTQTLALLPRQPALGKGAAVDGVPLDQRGMPPDKPAPDIGAYQSQGFVLTVAKGSAQRAAIDADRHQVRQSAQDQGDGKGSRGAGAGWCGVVRRPLAWRFGRSLHRHGSHQLERHGPGHGFGQLHRRLVYRRRIGGSQHAG